VLQAESTPGAAGRIKAVKNPNDPNGNRTHDLLACSSVPQSTAPPHTPGKMTGEIKF